MQNAALLLERSVLTELEVHQGLLKWRDHPSAVNLLGIVDCFMFPPFYPVFDIVEADSRSTANADHQDSCDDGNTDGAGCTLPVPTLPCSFQYCRSNFRSDYRCRRP